MFDSIHLKLIVDGIQCILFYFINDFLDFFHDAWDLGNYIILWGPLFCR